MNVRFDIRPVEVVLHTNGTPVFRIGTLTMWGVVLATFRKLDGMVYCLVQNPEAEDIWYVAPQTQWRSFESTRSLDLRDNIKDK